MRTAVVVMLCTAALASSERAAGELVTFHFFGIVEDVAVFNGSGLNLHEIAWPSVGTAISGTWTFDPSAPDTGEPPYFGVYRTDAPRAVTANIGEYAWHADDSYVTIHDATPPSDSSDLYEAGASRLTLDDPAPLGDFLDIWTLNIRLDFGADRWSDDLQPSDPLALAGPTRTVFTMYGDSTQRVDLSPVTLVALSGTLTMPILSDLDGDSDLDGSDFLEWQRRLGSRPTGEVSASVPEPGAGMLVAAALAGTAARRRFSCPRSR